jgi:hypothetical protein
MTEGQERQPGRLLRFGLIAITIIFPVLVFMGLYWFPLTALGMGDFSTAITWSLITLVVLAVISVIIYFVYMRVAVKA